ncbi:hypothetical protein [Bradyrhizobium arachidis]|uniref:Uncharacterized protein n=1 Tax=Bradyrhizobium arachidis TaxID=858423 RepID=A0AAE7TIG0_9BRAD|nr:hypothetical protein [Bradyrhizobium arachidis]QOZ68861.1 hypothetical protein WN72_22940 [Bradyrhizobium arachidis]SFV19268.1 hypothetical protein SAMN05192541_14816 [Bradyrhizobium arachidis]
MPEFDLEKSQMLRDAGMALVMDHNQTFKTQFERFIDYLPRGWTGTCEDIRRDWIGIVPHRNAWGACWNAAKKRGQLVELPIRVAMTASRSHGRRTNLHRKV